jgi:predicted peroxiredoxin
VTALAAVLSTREPERLYSGLSVLVSRAGDGEECAALVSFGALDLMLDADPGARGDSSQLFARSLAELRDTALAMDGLRFYVCSAAVETSDVDADLVRRQVGDVISTPRFLREHADAQLIFV